MSSRAAVMGNKISIVSTDKASRDIVREANRGFAVLKQEQEQAIKDLEQRLNKRLAKLEEKLKRND